LGITVLFGVRGGREVVAAASDGFQQRLLAGRKGEMLQPQQANFTEEEKTRGIITAR